MNIGSGLAVYFVIWWTVLFAVLPFGIRTQAEAGEVVPGSEASAPVRPRFVRIVTINTILSAFVFVLFRYAIWPWL